MGVKLSRSGGRGSQGRRRAHGVMSDINVTPFVDVMLVLLVVFMITAPLMTAGVAVDLPKTEARAISDHDNAPLEIAVDARGRIFVGETEMKIDRLKSTLSKIAAESPDRRVFVKADQKLSYGQVMAVMAAVNTSGFTKVALVTDSSSMRQ